MPLYEYACARCSKNFEELVYDTNAKPACPECAQNDQVERILFAKLMVGRKENLSPPNIKGMIKPRRR